ncbi:hypothetical protein K458DRAFT_395305 [Lentithecium fluviatile CBS 122367]|uniref:Uncharacterized protein n=1 Tax=Lentithecium fluviatile CBS 122367 TaxID=1168545 RepID=A0A6G1IID5_9PLEO|nr:hypothetical protein K458DRAFT_395305 [Lentithecium fluviatile CBS 122367]
MVPTVASSIAIDIHKGLGDDVSAGSDGLLGWLNPFAKPTRLVQKEYSPMKGTIAIPVGPGGGVGQVFGWGMPSFMVKKAKAESFLLELVEPLVTGRKWA